MSTSLSKPASAGNPHPQAVTAPAVAESQRQAALRAAVANLAGKSANRDALPAGAEYAVEISVSGSVNGHPVEALEATAALTVGHDSVRAANSLPYAQLLAVVLAKLNATTKAAVMRDVLAEIQASGKVPDVLVSQQGAVDAWLKTARASIQQPVRGSVSVKWAVNS